MKCIFAAIMNEALLCIGSNQDKETNMALCQQLLGNVFEDISYSNTSITTPYGEKYKSDFINQLAVVRTAKSQDEIVCLLKSVEVEMGRNAIDNQKGIVVIDIDLVVWNNKVLKPEDMTRDYVNKLLGSLPPIK